MDLQTKIDKALTGIESKKYYGMYPNSGTYKYYTIEKINYGCYDNEFVSPRWDVIAEIIFNIVKNHKNTKEV